MPAPQEEEQWATEMKWDGIRALAYIEDRALKLLSRNHADITLGYPELYPMAGSVGGHDVVLDGEIVAFDDTGRPSFGALAPRMHQRQPLRVAELARTVPVTFMAFDLLHINAASAISLPYIERRALLQQTVVPGYRWQVPLAFTEDAQAALLTSRRLGLEGVVCKRKSAPYRPGRRSSDWTKVKNFQQIEVVIGGWKPGGGRRSGMIGSLLLGAYDEAGRLLYVGHVGTGFTQAVLRHLGEILAPLERPTSPFALPVPREHTAGAHWVEPRLVGEVQYMELTGDARIRHPSWRGLRSDRQPRDVTWLASRRDVG
ncbi:non-homologous end-joining DNA ligase [Nonomuraea dietziae]|uniref:non-homologous end-joining DNA ligase n=1 Tax=Nonomuraea dietziae TaxID=65515 RepID=UPI0033E8A20C